MKETYELAHDPPGANTQRGQARCVTMADDRNAAEGGRGGGGKP